MTFFQGCIFWPLSLPPWRGGGRGTFWSLGKKIGPLIKKISELKKFKFFIENLFSITNLALKSNTLSFSFIIREEQFSFGKDSAQTAKALM
jgi:hypothetical protein